MCTRTCGAVGTKSRSRSEMVPASNGGQQCEGDAVEEENCQLKNFPIDYYKIKVEYEYFGYFGSTYSKIGDDLTKEGISSIRNVRLWKDRSDLILQEFPDFLSGSILYPIRCGVAYEIDITIEVAVECSVFLAFSWDEWEATQLHSMGFQKQEGSIKSSYGLKLQHIYKKCVANKETIKLPRTASAGARVAIFVK